MPALLVVFSGSNQTTSAHTFSKRSSLLSPHNSQSVAQPLTACVAPEEACFEPLVQQLRANLGLTFAKVPYSFMIALLHPLPKRPQFCRYFSFVGLRINLCLSSSCKVYMSSMLSRNVALPRMESPFLYLPF